MRTTNPAGGSSGGRGVRRGFVLRRRSGRAIAALAVLVVVGAGCSSESTSDGSTTTSVPVTSAPSTTGSTASTSPPSSSEPSTTLPAGLEQPAIWPAADVVFDDPELAAADFVVHVLQVPLALGEFMAGDSRSGEIEVSCIECNGSSRGVLFMRQLGAADGWFVTGVGNDVASFSKPVQGEALTAGVWSVEGTAYGFEANVSISAYVAGDEARLLDRQVVLAGSMAEPGPFSVTLDVSGAVAGDVVMLLIRGGVGLESDPGELGAIAVTVVG